MYSLPKSARVRRSAEFRHTLDQGKKAVSREIVVFRGEPGAPLPTPGARLGLIVSKKVGNAVIRNRVKRQVREAFRLLRPELPANAPNDLVVIARPDAAKASSAEIARSLSYCLRRLLTT